MLQAEYTHKRILLHGVLAALVALTATVLPVKIAGGAPLDEAKREQRQVVTEVARLDDEIRQAVWAKESVEGRLASTTDHLQGLSAALDSTSLRLDFKRNVFEQRLRNVYKAGKVSWLAVLLSVSDFNSLLTEIDFLKRVTRNDSTLVRDLKSEKRRLSRMRDDVAEKKQAIQEMKVYREQQLSILGERKTAKQKLLKQLDTKVRRLVEEEERRRELARQQKFTGTTGGGDVAIVEATVIPYPETFYSSERHPRKYQSTGVVSYGAASWYGEADNGLATASGEVFNENDFTAASKTLPFNTYLAITYNSRRIVVRINDHGPYVAGRVLDLSKRAAAFLGIDGVGTVKYEQVTPQ